MVTPGLYIAILGIYIAIPGISVGNNILCSLVSNILGILVVGILSGNIWSDNTFW